MSAIIKREAVSPPTIFSLRKMTHPSPNRNGAKGSYLVYDPQQNADDLFLEKKVNGVGGSAPGSPGSVQDYKQAVLKLQQEIEESHRKGSELEQIIADISSPNISQSARQDSHGLEGSSSSDSVGENVKDAHIKHLQRQVTVLQASLYKCEGWANRVSAALKERDNALDDLARLTNEMKILQEDNQQLQKRIETLGAALQDTQQNLQQVSEELQKQMYNGQLAALLREDVYKQKCEITTLKDSLSRLNNENKNLKDSGSEVNSHLLGNVACSQELENLHVVVDKLKDTVLEQRSYLLHLKKPNRNTKLQSSSASTAVGGGVLDLGFPIERKLSSPTPRSTGLNSGGSDIVAGNLSNQEGFGQSNWMAGLKTAGMKDSFLETKQPLCRIFSSPDFGQQAVDGSRRKLSSRDLLDDVFNLDVKSPSLFHKDGNPCSQLQPLDTPYLPGSSSNVPGSKHKSPDVPRQVGNRDVEKISNLTPGLACAPRGSLQHRTTQSEKLAQKQKVIQDKISKTEIIRRQQWHQSPVNNSAAQSYKPAASVVDKISQVSPGLTQGQKSMSAKLLHQDYLIPAEVQRQFLLNGNTAQNNYQEVVEYENVNRNSPTVQPQLIYHPPPSSQEEATHMPNHNAMFGGKVTAPSPPAHNTMPQGPNQEVVYINTSTGQGSGTITQTQSSAAPVSPRCTLNSDKLCPVCTNDYSQLSMEEFQTHVFECIDDQNQPETMKPQTVVPNKQCPMCNARFGPETTQGLYEQHVHSHFREENIEEPFIIIPS